MRVFGYALGILYPLLSDHCAKYLKTVLLAMSGPLDQLLGTPKWSKIRLSGTLKPSKIWLSGTPKWSKFVCWGHSNEVKFQSWKKFK